MNSLSISSVVPSTNFTCLPIQKECYNIMQKVWYGVYGDFFKSIFGTLENLCQKSVEEKKRTMEVINCCIWINREPIHKELINFFEEKNLSEKDSFLQISKIDEEINSALIFQKCSNNPLLTENILDTYAEVSIAPVRDCFDKVAPEICKSLDLKGSFDSPEKMIKYAMKS